MADKVGGEQAPETVAAANGIGGEDGFGAVAPPIYLSSTFVFPGFEQPGRYEYSRTDNPTRAMLADTLARLEGGAGAVVAASGLAAAMKLGRRPFRQSPNSVNWLTASRLPPISANERFIFPSSSGKIRKPTIFSARYSASPGPSSSPTPNRTSSPVPISPEISPATVTFARETRCTTARMCY